MKKNILIYLLFLTLFFIISCFSQIDLDSIWGYGFSYNIANGLLPYKDFNMVIGPLYSILFSILLKFGNYFYLFEIEHILFYSFIFTIIYNKIGKKSFFLFLLVSCSITIFGYNLFCVLLMLLILVLLDSDKKYSRIFIGIIIGTIIMTKQNIGGCLALLYLYTNRKKFISSCIYLSIPVIPIFIYLIYNGIFYSYFDFCLFGLGNFVDNFATDFVSFIPFIIGMYYLITRYMKKKDIKILYIIIFQICVFPIFDQGHVIPGFIPIFYYMLIDKDGFYIKNINMLFFVKYFVIIGFSVQVVIKALFSCEVILDDNYLKFQVIKKGVPYYIESYSNYLDRYNDSEIYLLIDNAYIIRLYKNQNPSFYDLINKGNLGSDENKYIEMMGDNCIDKECVFILDKRFFKSSIFDQRIKEFKDYVVSKYDYIETIPSGDRVYSNK